MKNLRCHVVAFILALVGCESPCTELENTNESVEDSASCRDFDPCTEDFFAEKGGCQHKQKASGSACSADGSYGECDNGLCVVTKHEFTDAVCVDASRECYGVKPYIINRIDGSCLHEWCNYDELGRSLRPKPAGSPCVRSIAGTPEFFMGQCSPCGECVTSN